MVPIPAVLVTCFKNVCEVNLASNGRMAATLHLEAWDLCICQRSAKAADSDSLTLQMIRMLIIPLSIHLNVQVAWWSSFVVLREDGMV